MKNFFTIPDNDLFLESSIDPMGLRVIWTYYAHKVFNNKLTTIANDIRVYSINLLHHCIVYELFQDRANINALSQNFKNTRPHKGIEREIKQGMLICLENIAILSFLEKESENTNEFDISGIPGSYNGRIKLNDGNPIYLAIDRKEEILKNQVNLGMAGRYIGPMREIGLFKKGLIYNDSEMNRLLVIFNSDVHYLKLKDKLKELLLYIFNSKNNNKRPEILFTELKRKYSLWNPIRDEYAHCFGKRKVWHNLRKYFLDNLGLNKGAAGAIYDSIDVKMYEGEIPGKDFRLIFSKAATICTDNLEKGKIEDIIKIAPVLSHIEYALRKLADPGTDSIEQASKDLRVIKENVHNQMVQLIQIKNNELVRLKNAFLKSDDLNKWIKGVVDYHKDIMDKRGGQAWLSVNEEDKIKHLFAPLLDEDYKVAKDYMASGFWYHHYYLNTLLGFKKSLNND